MSNLDDAWNALDRYLWYRIEDKGYLFDARIGGQESLVIMTGTDDNREYHFKIDILPVR